MWALAESPVMLCGHAPHSLGALRNSGCLGSDDRNFTRPCISRDNTCILHVSPSYVVSDGFVQVAHGPVL